MVVSRVIQYVNTLSFNAREINTPVTVTSSVPKAFTILSLHLSTIEFSPSSVVLIDLTKKEVDFTLLLMASDLAGVENALAAEDSIAIVNSKWIPLRYISLTAILDDVC